MYHAYILKCSDKTFYTGITTDLKRRIMEHNSSLLGAKYTRGRRPVKLIYSRAMPSKSAAQKEEYRIKKLSRKEKVKLIKAHKCLNSNKTPKAGSDCDYCSYVEAINKNTK